MISWRPFLKVRDERLGEKYAARRRMNGAGERQNARSDKRPFTLQARHTRGGRGGVGREEVMEMRWRASGLRQKKKKEAGRESPSPKENKTKIN
jgi:hypothetical protein